MDWRRRITNLCGEGKSYWGLTRKAEAVAIGALVVATFSIFMVVRTGRNSTLYDHQSSSCQFPAIYNFGDSNSDIGAVSAVFGRFPPPNGETYFHKPSGRLSDGRLIIDFIAERLGLPFLSAYLDSIGTNFRHGANFAASGCTIQPADAIMLNRTFNPLTLDVQLLQFEQFKERSFELYREEKSSEIKDRLPRSKDYARALYMFDIGQNDLHAGIISMKEEQLKTYISTIIDKFASAAEPGQVNPSMAGQVSNGVPRPMMVPGGLGTPTSGAPPMFTPSMYQVSPTAPSSGGFETSNNNAQSLDANH